MTSLEEDELVEIVDQVKLLKCHQASLMTNCDPSERSLAECSQHLERLEASAEIKRAPQANNVEEKKLTKHSKKRKSNDKSDSKQNAKITITCNHCKKKGHKESQCWNKPENAHLRPPKRSKMKPSKKEGEVMFLAKQFNYLVSCLPSFQSKDQKVHKNK